MNKKYLYSWHSRKVNRMFRPNPIITLHSMIRWKKRTQIWHEYTIWKKNHKRLRKIIFEVAIGKNISINFFKNYSILEFHQSLHYQDYYTYTMTTLTMLNLPTQIIIAFKVETNETLKIWWLFFLASNICIHIKVQKEDRHRSKLYSRVFFLNCKINKVIKIKIIE